MKLPGIDGRVTEVSCTNDIFLILGPGRMSQAGRDGDWEDTHGKAFAFSEKLTKCPNLMLCPVDH